MDYQNNNKNPNELHDYLRSNDCIPLLLTHNAEYDIFGKKTKEATEIHVEVEAEKENLLNNLVNQFMTE